MTTRIPLGGLLALVAVSAVGGGLYGLAGADGVPVAWLASSPFPSYWWPSAILLVAVGGACALAALEVLARWKGAERAAQAAGIITLGWITVQVAIIGYVSWLQPAVAAAGVTMLALATHL